MLIGLVGKPSVGKSTFFKATTLADVEIASYPFTTIRPNQGVGYVEVECIEKEFDVLKNDFGWNKLPFSKLEQNLVYLQITAICRNAYHYIIRLFSEKFVGLQPSFRIKRFW